MSQVTSIREQWSEGKTISEIARTVSVDSNAAIDRLIAEASTSTLKDFDEFLCWELENREDSRKARYVKNASFPTMKNLCDFRFDELRMPESMTKEDMTDLKFIAEKHTLVFYGICGSGKTMLSIALGIKACIWLFDVSDNFDADSLWIRVSQKDDRRFLVWERYKSTFEESSNLTDIEVYFQLKNGDESRNVKANGPLSTWLIEIEKKEYSS